MQVGSPDLAYALASNSLGTVVSTGCILLYLSAVGKPHARLVSVKSGASTCPANGCCCPQTRASQAAAQASIRLKPALVLAEEIQIGGLVARAKVLHVLLLLLLLLLLMLVQWLLLLGHWAREMCEWVGEVVAGKPAPMRRHCGQSVAVAATGARIQVEE